MNTTRRKFRKRPYQEPRDRNPLASSLRDVTELIHRRDFTAALSRANELLSTPGLASHEQSRVLGLVADSEYMRGAFEEAVQIYQRAAALALDHHTLWLRPLVGQVRALLKAVRVDEAAVIARHACDVAREKCASFDTRVRLANEELIEKGLVIVPALPTRVSVVATRMGFLFLDEGEPVAAREFFERALEVNPQGACRARQGLARIALATGDPAGALNLAEESIRIGNYTAKTIAAWPILIAARRKLGGWQISQNLLDGLEMVSPAIRARTLLIIVRELRKGDMRQWRDIALQWSTREGASHPIVDAEIRKMMLASAKTAPNDSRTTLEKAELLLQTPGLSRNEWLAAAKETVRAGLWEGRSPDLDALIRYADTEYGQDSGPRAVHSLALSCMMAKRHDLARPLLLRNLRELPAGNSVWAKSVWALARMESFLGNHVAAADLYRQFYEAPTIPLRFCLQAQLLWARELVATGKPDVILEARSLMTAALTRIEDPEILMNFARQLQFGPSELRDWGRELFAQGEALALGQFREASHPVVAMTILFKLARRQILDFDRYAEAVAFWKDLDAHKKDWLWSGHSCFWEYLGLIYEAYARLGDLPGAEILARHYLDDPATPPDGLPPVGIPYGRRLMSQGRAKEGLELFDRLARCAPTHPLCAEAWYWLTLAARRQGDIGKSKEYASRIRTAQGVPMGMLNEWNFDAKALLLLADLNPSRVDRQAVNYNEARLQRLLKQIYADVQLVAL